MFGYARPSSLDEALRLLAETPEARPLIGGTDLLVGVRKGSVRPPLVLDLKHVAELLPGVEERDGRLRITATTVLTRIIADERVRSRYPALVEAAQVVGSIQIRNRATLAGNLANASPAADTVPPLIVYGATVEVAGPAGRRSMAVGDFMLGPGRTALDPGELVTAVELPMPARPMGSAFGRMTRRRGVDLATVNLACAVTADGVTRLAFGAVGPRAFGAVDESGVLASEDADSAAFDQAVRRVTADATPISNVRASREYREAMLLVLTGRAVAEARHRLHEATDAA